MTNICSRQQIEEVLPGLDILGLIEDGFVAYSKGQAVVPPVGELSFRQPPGDVHIKYGYLENDDYYVIKIASGFYDNPTQGLASSNGMMLLFRQQTGEPLAILLDEGVLTDIRTAAAGAIVAKYMAPEHLNCVGIFGTGVQARLQLEYLTKVISCENVLVWGRSEEKLESYKHEVEHLGLQIESSEDPDMVASNSQLIVTTTPTTKPLFHPDSIQPGTHITAMGSDTPEKNEIPSSLLGIADLIVADSIIQCQERGEIHHAVERGFIKIGQVTELGDLIQNSPKTTAEGITIADLTGVAVQDIQIAKAVYHALHN